MIVVKSPLRVSLFGGGTDFPAYFDLEGGCVLTTAIDKYIFVTAKRRFDRKLRVGYSRTELVDRVGDIKHELIREALLRTGIQEGIEIATMGDIPSAGSGLGSSSTVTVGALRAMYAYLGESVSPDRLAREACEIEINQLARPIGIQDQYIAAYGGLRFLRFGPDGKVSVEDIALDPELQKQLDANLMLFYTGISRQAGTVLKEQKANIQHRLPVLREMKSMALGACDELLAGNLDSIGKLLHESWQLKKQMASNISNGKIEAMYTAARRAGAIGGKITGAGGGGFLLLYCPQEKQEAVNAALQDYKRLPFHFEQEGARVIFNYQRPHERVQDPPRSHAEFGDLASALFVEEAKAVRGPDASVSNDTKQHIQRYISDLQSDIGELSRGRIARAVELLHEARLRRRRVFIMGNGGSASTATHFVCDLTKNVRASGLPPFRALGLADNMAVFSAFANDEGYENVFAGQLAGQVESGDVVIGISTSGESPNVLKGIKVATEAGARTIGFTGFDGGQLRSMVDLNIHVPSNSIERIEDIHLSLEHMIINALRELAVGHAIIKEKNAYLKSERRVEEPADELLDPTSHSPAKRLEIGQANVELLYAINRDLVEENDPAEKLRGLLGATCENLGAESGSLIELDESGNVAQGFVVYEGKLDHRPAEQLAGVFEFGLAGWVAKNRQAALVPITRRDKRWLTRTWDDNGAGSRAALSVPLVSSNRVHGVLTLAQRESSPFTETDLSLLRAVAVCFSLNGAHH